MTQQQPKTYADYWKKPIWERACYAILYEVCAIIILAPISAYLLNKSMAQMGILTVIMATVAMLWNMLYNAIFDRLEHHFKINRTTKIRIVQALGFEGGLIFLLVPVAAWYLHVSYVQAFILDLGFFAFYLPYTYIFSWGYDAARKWFIERYLLGESQPRN